MSEFTLDSIRENPWNAVEEDIPAGGTFFLFMMARRAALYCARTEQALFVGALNGLYTPAADLKSDKLEGPCLIQDRWFEADDRAVLIEETFLLRDK